MTGPRSNEKLAKAGRQPSGGRGTGAGGDEVVRLQAEIHGVREQLAAATDRAGALERANGELCDLLRAAQIATVLLDDSLNLRSFTTAATRVFRLRESDVGQPLEALDSCPPFAALAGDVREVLAERTTVGRELVSSDGETRYIVSMQPWSGVYGEGVALTLLDVTSTIRAEAALRGRETMLRMLIPELQHRVRNTLAVVKSITLRTAETSRSVEDMAAHLIGRIDAFSRVQSIVTRNPESGVRLMALLQDEMLAHATHEGARFAMNGPDLKLQSNAAESLSLGLHELATNAIKHGALSGSRGQVEVNWTVVTEGDDHCLQLDWSESGMELPKGPQTRREGFGMELLLRALPYHLSAQSEIDFSAEGFRFSITMPAEKVLFAPAD